MSLAEGYQLLVRHRFQGIEAEILKRIYRAVKVMAT
jgi:hypothetical protein